MAEFSYFFDSVSRDGVPDRPFDSSDHARYFAQVVSNGIFWKNASVLKVNAESGMTVMVKDGFACINGRIYQLDGGKVLNIDYADGVLGRIDRVCIGLNMTERLIEVYIKAGTPSVNPVGKALIRTENLWELCLAEITVVAGASSITQSSILDKRLDNTVCGIVTGLIDQLDATDLDLQFRAKLQELVDFFNTNATNTYNQFSNDTQNFYNSYQNNTQAIFNRYSADTDTTYTSYRQQVEAILTQLSELMTGDLATNLQLQINAKLDKSELDAFRQEINVISEDMTQQLAAQNQRVDEALSSKADTVTYTATIPATGWSGSVAPYSIATITVPGMLATDTPIVDIVQTGTEATDSVMRENWGKITRIVTKADGISVYASEVPTSAILIQLKVVR